MLPQAITNLASGNGSYGGNGRGSDCRAGGRDSGRDNNSGKDNSTSTSNSVPHSVPLFSSYVGEKNDRNKTLESAIVGVDQRWSPRIGELRDIESKICAENQKLQDFTNPSVRSGFDAFAYRFRVWAGLESSVKIDVNKTFQEQAIRLGKALAILSEMRSDYESEAKKRDREIELVYSQVLISTKQYNSVDVNVGGIVKSFLDKSEAWEAIPADTFVFTPELWAQKHELESLHLEVIRGVSAYMGLTEQMRDLGRYTQQLCDAQRHILSIASYCANIEHSVSASLRQLILAQEMYEKSSVVLDAVDCVSNCRGIMDEYLQKINVEMKGRSNTASAIVSDASSRVPLSFDEAQGTALATAMMNYCNDLRRSCNKG